MLDRWQLVRCSPDRYAAPRDLQGDWDDEVSVEAPATVATVAGPDGIDDSDWWLRCSFDTEDAASVEFRGLTFPATVFLDGEHAAESESMFLPVRVDVGPGRHEICILFGSLNSWLATRRPRGRWRSSLVGAPGLRWARTTLLGRAPVYGDVPAPVGIWRPVVLTPAGHHVRCTVATDPLTGAVRIGGSTDAPDDTPVDVELRDPSDHVLARYESVVAAGGFVVDGRVAEPRPWWPRGYGAQPLYRAAVRVGGDCVVERAFGFRTVTASTDGAGFGIHVNGVPIFCRGATWAPPDAVRLSVGPDAMRDHVGALAGAGANLIRVVGGLVYEQDEFWSCCAELGVLVWQDAMQATFDPPAEVGDLIVREMVELLDAVSGNPALAVVSGGSETIQRPEMLGIESADATIDVIESLLPRAVAEHSGVPYVRSTPAAPADSPDLAIRPDTGIAHWFGVGGYLRPIGDVRSAGVGFAAECLAFANPPSNEAVERHFGSVAVAGHHPDWKAGVPRDRGSSWDFEDVRDFYAREVFGEDLLAVRRVDPGRYLQLGRLAIATAMRECFAFWRRRDSGCSGAIALAGKDTRPGAGWGLIDVDGAPKVALEVLARVWAPVAVILADDGLSGIRLDLHNDTPRALTGILRLVATNSTGAVVVDASRDVVVPAHASLTYADAELSGAFRDLAHAFRFGPPAADAVEATVVFGDGTPAVRDVLVVHPRAGQLQAALEAVARPRGDGSWELRVSAAVALRFVCVDASGWRASDNAFHLAANLPYSVVLRPTADQITPTGTVSSIDLLPTSSIEVR